MKRLCAEMARLKQMLKADGTPYEIVFDGSGNQVIYIPNDENRRVSVICNDVSIGGKSGLLEAAYYDDRHMIEGVDGYLTANMCMERISEVY